MAADETGKAGKASHASYGAVSDYRDGDAGDQSGGAVSVATKVSSRWRADLRIPLQPPELLSGRGPGADFGVVDAESVAGARTVHKWAAASSGYGMVSARGSLSGDGVSFCEGAAGAVVYRTAEGIDHQRAELAV